jgi:hypothetical protein
MIAVAAALMNCVSIFAIPQCISGSLLSPEAGQYIRLAFVMVFIASYVCVLFSSRVFSVANICGIVCLILIALVYILGPITDCVVLANIYMKKLEQRQVLVPFADAVMSLSLVDLNGDDNIASNQIPESVRKYFGIIPIVGRWHRDTDGVIRGALFKTGRLCAGGVSLDWGQGCVSKHIVVVKGSNVCFSYKHPEQ